MKKWIVLAGVVGAMMVTASSAVAEVALYTSPGDMVFANGPAIVGHPNPSNGLPVMLPDDTYLLEAGPGVAAGLDWTYGVGRPTVADVNLFGFVDGSFHVNSPSLKPWSVPPYTFATRAQSVIGWPGPSYGVSWDKVEITVLGGEITSYTEVSDPNGLWEQLNPHAIAYNYSAPGIVVMTPGLSVNPLFPSLFILGQNVPSGAMRIYEQVADLWLPDGTYSLEFGGSAELWSSVNFEVENLEIVWSDASILKGRPGDVGDPGSLWVQLGPRVVAFAGDKSNDDFVSMVSGYMADNPLDLKGSDIVSTVLIVRGLAETLNDEVESLNQTINNLNGQITSLGSQLSDAQETIGVQAGTISGLESQLAQVTAQRDQLVQDLAVVTAQRDQLLADLGAANQTIAAQAQQIANLISQVNGLEGQVDGLSAEVTRLTAEYDAAVAGLAEIGRLVGTPPGRRASDGVAGDTVLGGFANDIIDMLLAPPGQNYKEGTWRN